MRLFEAIFRTLTSSVGLDDMVQCPGSGRAESFENMMYCINVMSQEAIQCKLMCPDDKDDKNYLDDHFMAGITPCFTKFVDIRSHLGRESLLRLGSKERSKENHDCGFHLLSIFVTFVDFKQLLISLTDAP